MITGTGADIIFKIPVMRQIMAWIGTMPAKRKNITKIFEKGTKFFKKKKKAFFPESFSFSFFRSFLSIHQ